MPATRGGALLKKNVAPTPPKAKHPFESLSDEEKSARIDRAVLAGRMTRAQAVRARSFWKLPAQRSSRADILARQEAASIRAANPQAHGLKGELAALGHAAAVGTLGLSISPADPEAGYSALKKGSIADLSKAAGGKSLYNTTYKHGPLGAVTHPGAATGELALIGIPFLRGGSAARAAVKAVVKGEKAIPAFRQAFRESRPVINTLKSVNPVTKQMRAAARAANDPKVGGFTLEGHGKAAYTGEEHGPWVASLGAHEETHKGKTTAKMIADFRAKNAAVFEAHPDYKVGGWYDPETHTTFLDVTRPFHSGEEAQAFGRSEGQKAIFNLKTGETVETGLTHEEQTRIKNRLKGITPEQHVASVIDEASRLRAEQNRLASEERGRRAGNVESAYENLGGIAGHHSALAELKGQLPKLEFSQLSHLTDNDMHQLLSIVQKHPELETYQKVKLQEALLRAREGHVPTPYEIHLIDKAFGAEAALHAANPGVARNLLNTASDVLNVPRSLLASFDVSAPFRQGLVAGASNPRLFAKNFGPMFKALVSEARYGEIMHEIVTRPSFEHMLEDGLSLTELGHLSKSEEQFMSRLAERIPIIGRGVRASGRAYVVFLNRMRADMYDHLTQVARESGIEGRKSTRDIARFINVATGRGELPHALEGAAVALNATLFSPRLFFSRINVLNPLWYASLDPFARKQAIKAALRLVGAGTAVLGMAKLAGASVGTDPRNADFGKMRFGNTRIDIWGGHQQLVRLISQVASGKIVSSTTGETFRLSGGHSLSRQDIVKRFFEGKLAPTPAVINDWFKGTDFAGKPFEWKKEAISHMIPLLIQDAHDIHKDTGSITKTVGAYGVGAFGVGIQTYGSKPASNSTIDLGSTPSRGGSGALTRTGGSALTPRSGAGKALSR